MGVAVFDYDRWAARYPALAAGVARPLADEYFAEATLYLDNTDASLVEDVGQRLVLLNMLTAHIATLNGAGAGGQPGMVGRISQVTEGSVTIAADLQTRPGTEQWYAQTTPGLQYWTATAPYRTARYISGPQPYTGVPGVGGWGFGWGR